MSTPDATLRQLAQDMVRGDLFVKQPDDDVERYFLSFGLMKRRVAKRLLQQAGLVYEYRRHALRDSTMFVSAQILSKADAALFWHYVHQMTATGSVRDR